MKNKILPIICVSAFIITFLGVFIYLGVKDIEKLQDRIAQDISSIVKPPVVKTPVVQDVKGTTDIKPITKTSVVSSNSVNTPIQNSPIMQTSGDDTKSVQEPVDIEHESFD